MRDLPIYTSTRYYGSLPQEGSAIKGILITFAVEALIALFACAIWFIS